MGLLNNTACGCSEVCVCSILLLVVGGDPELVSQMLQEALDHTPETIRNRARFVIVYAV